VLCAVSRVRAVLYLTRRWHCKKRITRPGTNSSATCLWQSCSPLGATPKTPHGLRMPRCIRCNKHSKTLSERSRTSSQNVPTFLASRRRVWATASATPIPNNSRSMPATAASSCRNSAGYATATAGTFSARRRTSPSQVTVVSGTCRSRPSARSRNRCPRRPQPSASMSALRGSPQ